MNVIVALLEKYSAINKEELIQAFLKQLEDKTVTEQLHQRKIKKIVIRKRLTSSRALLLPVRGGFIIILSENNKDERSKDIGHELAHTFFYDLDSSIPTHYGKITHEEEELCEAFALRWAKIHEGRDS